MDWGDSHTVVVVPVPELEPFVLARTRHYDPAWVSTDPSFTHAHVTLLAPWLPDPSEDDLAALAEIAGGTPGFDFTLSTVEEFPNGVIHLPTYPDAPFSGLLRRVSATFPDLLPYGGLFGSVGDLTPHVTLDRRSSVVDVSTTRELLGDLIPVTCRADRLEVHRYAPDDCHVIASFRLN